jgi:hypothetical protein
MCLSTLYGRFWGRLLILRSNLLLSIIPELTNITMFGCSSTANP